MHPGAVERLTRVPLSRRRAWVLGQGCIQVQGCSWEHTLRPPLPRTKLPLRGAGEGLTHEAPGQSEGPLPRGLSDEGGWAQGQATGPRGCGRQGALASSTPPTLSCAPAAHVAPVYWLL